MHSIAQTQYSGTASILKSALHVRIIVNKHYTEMCYLSRTHCCCCDLHCRGHPLWYIQLLEVLLLLQRHPYCLRPRSNSSSYLPALCGPYCKERSRIWGNRTEQCQVNMDTSWMLFILFFLAFPQTLPGREGRFRTQFPFPCVPVHLV